MLVVSPLGRVPESLLKCGAIHTAEDGMRELEIDEWFNEYKEKKDDV